MQNLSDPAGSSRFEATSWTLILDAGRHDDAPELARAALLRLCRTYWTPLYGYVRAQGHSIREAEELTHGFFARLIDQGLHARADPARGKFRTFLLAALRKYLADADGGERGNPAAALLPEQNVEAAETLFQDSVAPAAGSLSGDGLFERQWAVTLLRTTLDRLAAEYTAEGRAALFEALQVFVRGTVRPLPTDAELSARLGLSAESVRRQIETLRVRYRAALRSELRRTVDADREVDAELRGFLQVLTPR